MKRTTILHCLVLPFLLGTIAQPCISALASAENAIGAQATWSISGGTLTISGEGSTYNYDIESIYGSAVDQRPWGE